MRTLLRRPRRSDRGFTLIELLIVIVILGVLAGIVVFAVSAFNDRGVTAACQADRKTVETAVEAYRAKNNAYPNAETDTPSGWDQLTGEGFLREAPSTEHYQIHLNADGDVAADCGTPGPQPSGSAGGGGPSPSAGTGQAGPVTGIALSGQTATTVHVTWNAPTTGGPFSQYMIWAYQNNPAPCGTPFIGSAWAYTLSPSSTQTDIDLTSLIAGQSYNMCVQAIVPESNGALDGPAGFVTFTQQGAAGPAAPGGVSASNIDNNSAQINWNSVSGATGYQVRLNGGTPVDDSGSPYTTPNNLSANTSYTVEVRARTGNGGGIVWGTWSTAVTFVTLPNSPGNPNASGVNNSWDVTFSWSAPSGGAHHYEVQWSYNSSFSSATTVNPASSPITLNNPNHNVTIYFRVRAVNSAGGTSGWSTDSVFNNH